MPLSEELKRLHEKAMQWGDRPLKGGDLAYLIDQVGDDMHAADPGPEPYDLSARPGRKQGRLGVPRSRLG